MPSPFRSRIATDRGPVSVAKSDLAAKEPVPSPSSTDTVSLSRFATARSRLPSPFRSPITTECGREPVAKSVLVPKAPAPLPSSTDTVLLPKFPTARSGLPSPFRSPIATEVGPVSVAKSVLAAKDTDPAAKPTEAGRRASTAIASRPPKMTDSLALGTIADAVTGNWPTLMFISFALFPTGLLFGGGHGGGLGSDGNGEDARIVAYRAGNSMVNGSRGRRESTPIERLLAGNERDR